MESSRRQNTCMDKIVKWEVPHPLWAAMLCSNLIRTEDPNLESYTLERFGLKTAAAETVEPPVPEKQPMPRQETNNSADNQTNQV